jgi:O-acetyl-ADP-ribose deacetylase
MVSSEIKKRIELLKGDITKLSVDAIVNAANSTLMGGGGVDGAIHRAGGPAILEACKEIVRRQGECKTGEAVITTAGALSCRYVIHTVGPIWRGGQDSEKLLLSNCYSNSLKLAHQYQCETIAFPNISTGIYGFPKPLASEIAASTVTNFLRDSPEMKKVILVCFDEENYHLLQNVLGGK